jgi:hypothetical protein
MHLMIFLIESTQLNELAYHYQENKQAASLNWNFLSSRENGLEQLK